MWTSFKTRPKMPLIIVSQPSQRYSNLMKLISEAPTDSSTVVEYYKNITHHSVVSQVEPGYLRKILPDSAPQDGEAWEAITKDFDSKIVPGITHWYNKHTPPSHPILIEQVV